MVNFYFRIIQTFIILQTCLLNFQCYFYKNVLKFVFTNLFTITLKQYDFLSENNSKHLEK